MNPRRKKRLTIVASIIIGLGVVAGLVTVSYDGILPDLFREGQGIVANGVLVNGNMIEASEVLAKHDENYMPKELADDANEQHVKQSYSKEQLETTN